MKLKINKNIARIGFKVSHVNHLLNIKKNIYNVLSSLSVEAIVSDEPIKYENLNNFNFHSVDKGYKWGKRFGCAWFRFKGKLPEIKEGKKIVAIVNIMGEGLVYNKDGVELQGITTILAPSDVIQTTKAKQIIDLDNIADNEGNVLFLVDSGNNNMLRPENLNAKLKRFDLAEVNQELFDYYYDYITLFILWVQ
jgi:alpha-mannosidase